MKCTSPIYAVDLGIKENGKRNLKILPKRFDLYSAERLYARYGKDSVLSLPCGHCLSCRLNKGREWAVRCVLEASLYNSNYFVTLTYDDDHLPSSSLNARRDVQLFLRMLRRECPGVRYFGCCEKGSKTKRFHHHLILFNCDLNDYRPLHKNYKGGYIYSSKLVEKLWSKGNVCIGEVNYTTCGYVAQYAAKKVFNDDKDEFIYMSNRPGIGAKWFEKHVDIFKDDAIYGRFGFTKSAKIPRYFEKLYELIDPVDLASVKEKRIDKSSEFSLYEMLLHGLDQPEKLLSYKNELAIHEFISRKKGLRSL